MVARFRRFCFFFNPDKNAPNNNNNFVKKMRAKHVFCFLVKSACFQENHCDFPWPHHLSGVVFSIQLSSYRMITCLPDQTLVTSFIRGGEQKYNSIISVENC